MAWFLAVAVLTLQPEQVLQAQGSMPRFCLVCGDRGAADAILNVVMFLPLGALVAMGGGSRAVLRGATTGMLISLAIEATQASIPGRYAGAGDVVWNALGGGVGAMLWLWLTRRITATLVADRGLASALLMGTVLFGTGVALSPHLTEPDYYGQWTPNLGHMPRYGGQVLDASLDGVRLPAGLLDWQPHPRVTLQGPWTVRADIVVGPRPIAVSPIVSIYDAQRMEILLVGADGPDVVLRERTVAKFLFLDQPDLRVPGAFEAASKGDTIRIGASRDGDRRCLTVGEDTRCDLGFTAARTWGLLYYPDGLSETVRSGLDLIWLAVLFFPVGFLTTSPRGAAMAGFLAMGGATLAAGVTRLIAPPVGELMVMATSVALGFLLARRLRSHARSRREAEGSVGEQVRPG